jgi:serine/threonine protein kinase
MAGFVSSSAETTTVATIPQLSYENYEIQFPHLQEGGWGKVYSAVVKNNSQEFVAMKFFGYTKQQPITSEIMKEINLMKNLIGVEGVVQLVGVFADTPQGYSNDDPL